MPPAWTAGLPLPEEETCGRSLWHGQETVPQRRVSRNNKSGNGAMIQMPRRSVTRFFIPLIDVLILLFCIFLLMPYVKPVEGDVGDVTGKGTIAEPPPEAAPGDVAELRREIERLRADREQLLRDRDT